MPEAADREQKIAGLRGWHQAKEEATRHNRNLLQYAAGIAAVLAIGAGSGGMFAVAGSLTANGSKSLPDWAYWYLAGTGGAAVFVAVLLAVLLVIAFSRRGTAERVADHHLGNLIEQEHDRFWPKEE